MRRIHGRAASAVKRALDVAIASTAIVAGAPLLAVLAILVKLDSRGPALFAQTRVGRDKRPIRVLKLRTMFHGELGPQVTTARDPRITRLGALLRRTKLDELPQLWNVIRGDMSIVGPRPEVADYVALYLPSWQRLLAVRPGLTDVASLAFRDEESLLACAHDRDRAYIEVVMPMKLELALTGLDHNSPLSDLAVIARTVIAVLMREPSPHPAVLAAAKLIATLNDQPEQMST